MGFQTNKSRKVEKVVLVAKTHLRTDPKTDYSQSIYTGRYQQSVEHNQDFLSKKIPINPIASKYSQNRQNLGSAFFRNSFQAQNISSQSLEKTLNIQRAVNISNSHTLNQSLSINLTKRSNQQKSLSSHSQRRTQQPLRNSSSRSKSVKKTEKNHSSRNLYIAKERYLEEKKRQEIGILNDEEGHRPKFRAYEIYEKYCQSSENSKSSTNIKKVPKNLYAESLKVFKSKPLIQNQGQKENEQNLYHSNHTLKHTAKGHLKTQKSSVQRKFDISSLKKRPTHRHLKGSKSQVLLPNKTNHTERSSKNQNHVSSNLLIQKQNGAPHIKIQKYSDQHPTLFICFHCLQVFNIIEIEFHYRHCEIVYEERRLLKNLQKLIELLKNIYESHYRKMRHYDCYFQLSELLIKIHAKLQSQEYLSAIQIDEEGSNRVQNTKEGPNHNQQHWFQKLTQMFFNSQSKKSSEKKFIQFDNPKVYTQVLARIEQQLNVYEVNRMEKVIENIHQTLEASNKMSNLMAHQQRIQKQPQLLLIPDLFALIRELIKGVVLKQLEALKKSSQKLTKDSQY